MFPHGDPPSHMGGHWCSLEPFVLAGHRSSPRAALRLPLGFRCSLVAVCLSGVVPRKPQRRPATVVEVPAELVTSIRREAARRDCPCSAS